MGSEMCIRDRVRPVDTGSTFLAGGGSFFLGLGFAFLRSAFHDCVSSSCCQVRFLGSDVGSGDDGMCMMNVLSWRVKVGAYSVSMSDEPYAPRNLPSRIEDTCKAVDHRRPCVVPTWTF